MRTFTLIAAAAVFSLASCTKKAETTNSSSFVSEIRYPGSYTDVELSAPAKMTIVRGDACSIELKGNKDLVENFNTTVDNNHLSLQYRSSHPTARNSDLELVVYTTRLSSITINGSAVAVVNDGFGDSLTGIVNGSGSLQILGGTFDMLRLTVNGSGFVDTKAATSTNADVTISGSGNINVRVRENLKARIDGSGLVSYYGSPLVSSEGDNAINVTQIMQRNAAKMTGN